MFWSQSKDNIWIVGHRGVRALLPENTLISFQKAIDLGLNGIETDIHMTTDGQLVLHHDDTLERTTDGSGKIETGHVCPRIHLALTEFYEIGISRNGISR